MKSAEIKIYKSILLSGILAVMLIGLFTRCANIGTPQGGPRDSIAPRVVIMNPGYGTTKFKGKRIYIEFNEYVQLKDQQKEFYTSPLMTKKPLVMLKGKGIRIDLKEELDSNRTYSLNFGQSVRDNNEGNPYTGLRYVFSTGDRIDSMVMSGYTINGQTGDSASSVFIYFFEANDTLKVSPYDSTMFLHQPHSVGRSLPNGIFVAENLKPVPYRIYALEDKNGNMKYEPGVDKIGFMDSIYNPIDMPPFNMWYDTTRKYMVADPQILIPMFTDKPFKRQNLTKTSRPLQNKLFFEFMGPNPQIDSLSFEGIDPSEIITEYMTPAHDSIIYWLNVPSERLADTIKGRIAYQKHDSTGTLYTHGQNLKLAWKAPAASKKEKKVKEGEEEKVENPFKVNVTADKVLIPEKEIKFEFDYPLRRIDTAAIELIKLAEDNSGTPPARGRDTRVKVAPQKDTRVKISFERDSINIRKWILKSDWKPEEKYRLTIPEGAFENIKGEQNDTLKTDFAMDSPDKYATFLLTVKGKTPDAKYVIQILDKSDKIIKELKDISTGFDTIKYIPVGEVKIKVIEDLNGNGVWDSGSLVERLQNERIETFTEKEGVETIVTKERWDQVIVIDMNELFKPIDMEYMRRKLAALEEIRLKARAERLKNAEKDKNKNKNTNQGNSGFGGQSGAGGMGGGGGMGAGGMSVPGLRR